MNGGREERTWGKGIRQGKDFFFFLSCKCSGKGCREKGGVKKIFNGARWL